MAGGVEGHAGGIVASTVQAGGQNGAIRRLDASEWRDVPRSQTAHGHRPLDPLSLKRADSWNPARFIAVLVSATVMV